MMINKKHIRVIGDIHGNAKDFVEFTQDAIQKDMHIVCVGDYVDRGSNSPGVMSRVLMLMQMDNVTPIVGNHDDKFWRWLNGSDVKIAHGLDLTIRQLEDHPHGDTLKEQWLTEMPKWPVWVTHGNVTFVHGAFHPVMLRQSVLLHKDKKDFKAIVARAFYGQVEKDQSTEDGFPVRRLDWVDEIPEGHTVFVGHHVYSETEIIRKTGAQGGTAVFVDTGSGKGGPLSFIDIEV